MLCGAVIPDVEVGEIHAMLCWYTDFFGWTHIDMEEAGMSNAREPESPLIYGRLAAAACGLWTRPSTCRSSSVATIHPINVPHTAS